MTKDIKELPMGFVFMNLTLKKHNELLFRFNLPKMINRVIMENKDRQVELREAFSIVAKRTGKSANTIRDMYHKSIKQKGEIKKAGQK